MIFTLVLKKTSSTCRNTYSKVFELLYCQPYILFCIFALQVISGTRISATRDPPKSNLWFLFFYCLVLCSQTDSFSCDNTFRNSLSEENVFLFFPFCCFRSFLFSPFLEVWGFFGACLIHWIGLEGNAGEFEFLNSIL